MWENGGATSEDLQQGSGGSDVLRSSMESLRASIEGLDIASVSNGVEDAWNKLQGLFKILFSFMQVVSSLSINLPSVNWPESVISIWDTFGTVANIDIISGLSLDCVNKSWNFYSTFALTVSLPLVSLVITVVVTAIRVHFANDKDQMEHAIVQAWQFCLVGSFVIYPSASATILKVWHCREIGDTWRLAADYRLQCHGSEYDMYSGFAAVAFFIYPVGIPCLYLYELFSKHRYLYEQDWDDLAAHDRATISDARHALLSPAEMAMKHQRTVAKYGFLYSDYEPRAYYWEIVMLIQKLLLTGLLIFIKPGTVSQLAAGFVISLGFFVAHVRILAYKDDDDDDFQFASMLTITLNLFGGILLMAETQEEDTYGAATMTILFFAINAGMALLFIYLVYMSFMGLGESSRVTLREKMKALIEEALFSRVTDAITASGIPEAARCANQLHQTWRVRGQKSA